MKLNRRQGLMAIVGGLFGSKDAAKTVLQDGSLLRGTSTLKTEEYLVETTEGIIDHAYPGNQIEQYDKLIAGYQKIINGGLEDWQERQLANYDNYRAHAGRHRIDGLKSVAPHYKLSMIDRMEKQRMRAEWVRDARRELKDAMGYKQNILDSIKNNIFTKGTIKSSEGNLGVLNKPPRG